MNSASSYYRQPVWHSLRHSADLLDTVKPRVKYARHILLVMVRIVFQSIPIWGFVWLIKASSGFFDSYPVAFVGTTLRVMAVACGFATLFGTLWIIGYGLYRVIRVLLGFRDPGENEHL